MRLEVGHVHVHTWKNLRGYERRSWRCTTAESVRMLTDQEPCDPACKQDHQHYFEDGCLAALTYWPTRKVHVFCAPGTYVMELSARPREMLIDDLYIRRLTEFREQLATVVEYDAHAA